MIYTTKALESVNMSWRKIIKRRGSYPAEEAAIKLLYLALRSDWNVWKLDNSVSLLLSNKTSLASAVQLRQKG